MKAVFLDRGSFPNTVHFRQLPGIQSWSEYDYTPPEKVLERLQDAEIAIANKTVLTADLLAACPNLKMIQVTATGTNNVDLPYCEKHGILVRNVTGYSTISVPEHTFALLLALRRSLFQYTNAVENQYWAQSQHFCFLDYPIQDLSGSQMTIIGSGMLGQSVARLAQAFGIHCVFAERKGSTQVREGYVAFDKALADADIVSLHCPLTAETTHLIDQREFDLMKSSAILLNTGRGGLVNEQALANALQNGQIAAAGFDVATVEPMPQSHLLQALSRLPNFLLTPHVAWASQQSMQKLADIAMGNIEQFLAKQTP